MTFVATTTNSAVAWRPDTTAFAPEDVVGDALILQCSTVAGTIDGDAPSVRVAYVTDDEADFQYEAYDIAENEPTLSEVLVQTGKIAMLVRLSNEQWGQQGTAEQLAQSVGRAVVRKADKAFLQQEPPNLPIPAPPIGLVYTPGILNGTDPINASLDALIDLVARLESNLSTPSHILIDPLGWSELRKLKIGVDFNSTLLGAGTSDTIPMLLGLPVIVTPAMPTYSGLIVDRRAVVSAVGRVNVSVSTDRYFESDSVALRCTWRIGSALVRPERIGLFAITPTYAPGS